MIFRQRLYEIVRYLCVTGWFAKISEIIQDPSSTQDSIESAPSPAGSTGGNGDDFSDYMTIDHTVFGQNEHANIKKNSNNGAPNKNTPAKRSRGRPSKSKNRDRGLKNEVEVHNENEGIANAGVVYFTVPVGPQYHADINTEVNTFLPKRQTRL